MKGGRLRSRKNPFAAARAPQGRGRLAVAPLVVAVVVGAAACDAETGEPAGERPALAVETGLTALPEAPASSPYPAGWDPTATGGDPALYLGAACQLPELGRTGRTFYFCDCADGASADCVPGDDSNAADTPERPRRTLAAAQSLWNDEVRAGDTVALCRGGAFPLARKLRLAKDECQPDAPCTLRAYDPPWASGALLRPLVLAEDGGLTFANNGDASPDAGYVVADVHLRAEGSGVGVFVFNDSDHLQFCHVKIEGFDLGFNVQYANDPVPEAADADLRSTDITVAFSEVVENRASGWLGNSARLRVVKNLIARNGTEPHLHHNFYMDAHMVAEDVVVALNEIGHGGAGGRPCAGPSVVIHGEAKGVRIEGNLLVEAIGAAEQSCWGITVDAGWGSRPEKFEDVIVASNTLLHVGGLGIGLSACRRCTVENNAIVMLQPLDAEAIAAPNRERDGNDGRTSEVVVRHNSILIGSDGRAATAIRVGGEGKRHAVYGNAVHALGAGDFACFALPSKPADYARVDANTCFFPDASAGAWLRDEGDLAQSRRRGFDAASAVADPGFRSVDPSAPDLVPTPGSPLLGAGLDEGPATDRAFRGRANVRDRGAYQVSRPR